MIQLLLILPILGSLLILPITENSIQNESKIKNTKGEI